MRKSVTQIKSEKILKQRIAALEEKNKGLREAIIKALADTACLNTDTNCVDEQITPLCSMCELATVLAEKV